MAVVIKEGSTKNLELRKINLEPLFIMFQELELKAKGERIRVLLYILPIAHYSLLY